MIFTRVRPMGDFDFDDDMPDDFDNIGDGDNEDQLEPPSTKREAVTRVLKKAAKAGTKDIKDVDKQIDGFLDKGLPRNLAPIREDYDNTKMELQSAYYEATKQLKPKVGRITKQIDKLVPDKLKPVKKLTSALAGKFSEESAFSYSSNRDPLAEIADKVKNLLPDTEAPNDLLKEQLEQNRHAQRSDLLAKIATYQQASFEVSRTREATYQRKHLELMYKSVFYHRETYEVLTNSFKTLKEQLEAVIANTGLPEVLKIKKTERFSELIRDQYLGAAQSNLFGNAEWFSRGLDNLKKKISDSISGTADLLDMAEGGVEGFADVQELGGGGIDKTVGTAGAGFLTGKVYGGISRGLLKNPKTSAIVKRLASTYKNAPEELEQFLASDRARKIPALRNIGFAALNLIRPAGGQFGIETTKVDLNNPAVFNGNALKSITTVIPGYLSRILAQVTSIRTGDKPEMILYDHRTDKFKDKTTLRKQIRKDFITAASNSGVGRNIDTLINDVLGDTEISDKDRAALKRRIINTVTDPTKGDSVSRLKSTGVFEGLSPDVVKRFEAVANNTEEDGVVVEDDIRRARSMLPRFKEELAKLIDAGYGSLLLQEGIVSRKNGQWVMSIAKFRKFLNIPSSNTYPTMSEEAKDVKKAVASIQKFGKTAKDAIKKRTAGTREDFNKIAGNYWDALVASKLGKGITNSKSIKDLKRVFNQIKDPKEREVLLDQIRDPAARANLIRTVKDPEERKRLIKRHKDSITNSSRVKGASTIASNYWEAITGGIKGTGVVTVANNYREAATNGIKGIGANVLNNNTTSTDEGFIGPPRPAIETMGEPVVDASDGVQEITQLKTKDKKLLDRALDSVGISKLSESGVIGKVRNGKSVFVNMGGIKSLLGRVTGGRNTTSVNMDNDTHTDVSTGAITERIDTHLKYMEMLLGVTTTISEQISSLGSATGLSNKDSKFKAIRDKVTGILSKPVSGIRKIGSKVGNPMNFIKNISSRLTGGLVGKVKGGLASIAGMVGPLRNALLAPLEMAKDISMSMLGYFGRKLGKAPAAMMRLLRTGAKGASAFGTLLLGEGNRLIDLYGSPNADTPVFKANAAKMGMYINASTGKVISGLRDITGTVVDIDGNVVLTNDDIIRGLYDTSGKEVRLGAARKKGAIRVAGGFIKRGLTSAIRRIRGLSIFKGFKTPKFGKSHTNIKDRLGDVRNVAEYVEDGSINARMYAESITHTGLLMDIRALVSNIVAGGNWNDKNRDGFRDNSWRDMLNRVNKKKTPTSKKDDQEDKKGGGVFGNMLSSVLGIVGPLLSGIGGLGSGLLKTLTGALGAYWLKNKLPIPTGKPGGMFSWLFGKTKQAFSTVAKHIPGKALIKKLPIVGTAMRVGATSSRLYKGQYGKAAGEVLSGLTGLIPFGGGIAASIYLDNIFGLDDDDTEEDKALGKPGRNTATAKTTGIPILKTPMVGPEDGPMYIRLAPGVRMDGLNPVFKELFYSMVSEYGKMTGNIVQVNSAYRTVVKTRCSGSKVNTTCSWRSMHAHGLAIDINHGDADKMEKLGLMRKYGITRPIGQEKWHLEPSGIQIDLDRARRDPVWATEQIKKGIGKGGGGYALVSSARKEGRDPSVARAVLNTATDIDTKTIVDNLEKKTNVAASRPKEILPTSYTVPSKVLPTTAPIGADKYTRNTTSDNAPPTYARETLAVLEESLEVQKLIANNIQEIRNSINNTPTPVEKPEPPPVAKPRPTKLPDPAMRLTRS